MCVSVVKKWAERKKRVRGRREERKFPFLFSPTFCTRSIFCTTETRLRSRKACYAGKYKDFFFQSRNNAFVLDMTFDILSLIVDYR